MRIEGAPPVSCCAAVYDQVLNNTSESKIMATGLLYRPTFWTSLIGHSRPSGCHMGHRQSLRHLALRRDVTGKARGRHDHWLEHTVQAMIGQTGLVGLLLPGAFSPLPVVPVSSRLPWRRIFHFRLSDSSDPRRARRSGWPTTRHRTVPGLGRACRSPPASGGAGESWPAIFGFHAPDRRPRTCLADCKPVSG